MPKLFILTFVSLILSYSLPSYAPAQATTYSKQKPVTFDLCNKQKRINCVVDGDTFWFRGQKIRIADIDTPETFRPNCAQEKALGQQAKSSLLKLLNQGPFTMIRVQRDRDYFGRRLRIIKRSGVSLGASLVEQKLARRWNGARKSWCG